jgi:hypothetical protein
MMKITPPAVYVKDTGTSKGRGAFAARSFAKDEVVEICPVVPFLMAPEQSSLPPAIHRIMYNWGYLIGKAGPQAIALGYGSMYNHANPANLRYEADPHAVTLRFIAVRAIEVDEELTINYNAHGGAAQWDGEDDWFARMRIEPIAGA